MSHAYFFKGARIVTAEGTVERDLRVRSGQIREIGPQLKALTTEVVLECTGSVIYPGLINSHDHLGFSLFPRLGEPPYKNAYEWGEDLHRRWRTRIESITRIPLRYRLYWGAWKNLFSGVTRVVHHDIYSSHFRLAFPVDVLHRYSFAHSLQFDQNLHRALQRRKRGVPFLIHLAEGTDELSRGEVTFLKNLGGLDERTVAVHAVGLTENDINLITEAQTSVVWCPSSNLFLYGKTAPIQSLSSKIPIALGTDSTLTGSATLFEELRTAHSVSVMSAKELFNLVTERPRTIFRMTPDAGTLHQGGRADLFLLPANMDDPFETLLAATPGDISLLMKGGEIVFFDLCLFPSLMNDGAATPVRVNGRIKVVQGKRFSRVYKHVKPFVHHYSYLNTD